MYHSSAFKNKEQITRIKCARQGEGEWKIQADITGVFISGFQIKFVFFVVFNIKKGKSDDAEKGFRFHFFRLFRLLRLLRTIMMIEEMDFRGDGRINKTIFHLHQASSFPSSLFRHRGSL